ncbi:hypothetical protein D7B12_18145 [Salmonella enterica]|nr:hypothetical protein [Salmonella enterica]
MKKLITSLAVLALTAAASMANASDWNYYRCGDGSVVKFDQTIGEINNSSQRLYFTLNRVIDNGKTDFVADVYSQGQHFANMSVQGQLMLLQIDGDAAAYKCYFAGSDAGLRAYNKEKEQERKKAEAEAKAKQKAEEEQAAKDKAAQAQIFAANLRRADAFVKQMAAKPFKEGEVYAVTFPQNLMFEQNEVKKYTCDVLTFSAVGEAKFRATSYRKGAVKLALELSRASITYKKDDKMSDTTSSVNLHSGNLPVLVDKNGTTALIDSQDKNASYYELYNCERNYF